MAAVAYQACQEAAKAVTRREVVMESPFQVVGSLESLVAVTAYQEVVAAVQEGQRKEEGD